MSSNWGKSILFLNCSGNKQPTVLRARLPESISAVRIDFPCRRFYILMREKEHAGLISALSVWHYNTLRTRFFLKTSHISPRDLMNCQLCVDISSLDLFLLLVLWLLNSSCCRDTGVVWMISDIYSEVSDRPRVFIALTCHKMLISKPIFSSSTLHSLQMRPTNPPMRYSTLNNILLQMRCSTKHAYALSSPPVGENMRQECTGVMQYVFYHGFGAFNWLVLFFPPFFYVNPLFIQAKWPFIQTNTFQIFPSLFLRAANPCGPIRVLTSHDVRKCLLFCPADINSAGKQFIYVNVKFERSSHCNTTAIVWYWEQK